MPADVSTQTEVKEDLSRKVHEIIDRIKAIPHDERFRRVKGSYLFFVEGMGSWKIDVDHGKMAVTDGALEGDCIIRAEAEDFLKIAKGEQNLLTAAMQGRIELEGDMALAQKLLGVTPAPAKEAGKQGGEA